MTTSPARTAAELASLLPMGHPLASVARLRLDALVREERTVKVEAPNQQFTGTSCGVQFVDGTAETNDPAALNYFREAGYSVDGEQVERPAEPEPIDPRDITTVRINPFPERA